MLLGLTNAVKTTPKSGQLVSQCVTLVSFSYLYYQLVLIVGFVCVDPILELVHVPVEHTGLKIGEKIVMKCGAAEQER